MHECPDAFTDGVFGPSEVQILSTAFARAEDHVRTSGAAAFGGGIDRCELARRIVSEARAGELQADLLWRATLARMLAEQRIRAA